MACGGCGGFNPDKHRMVDGYDALSLLRGREVVLFPDNGKYDEWSERAKRLLLTRPSI